MVQPRACGDSLLPGGRQNARFKPGFNPAPAGIPDASLDRQNGAASGFNPAPAGNPHAESRPRRWRGCPVQPRACGESLQLQFTTPILPVRVQPRACGESTVPLLLRPWDQGSTPRLRGIPVAVVDRYYTKRFNPAPAGNPAHSFDSQILAVGSTPRLRGIPLDLDGYYHGGPVWERRGAVHPALQRGSSMSGNRS